MPPQEWSLRMPSRPNYALRTLAMAALLGACSSGGGGASTSDGQDGTDGVSDTTDGTDGADTTDTTDGSDGTDIPDVGVIPDVPDVSGGDDAAVPDVGPTADVLDVGPGADVPDTSAPEDAGPDVVQPPLPKGLVLVAGARSCEVLVHDPKGRVTGVAFGDGTLGKMIREGDRLAVTCLRTGDTDLGSDAIQLLASGGDLSGVTLSRGACFNRVGAALPNSSPSLP